MTSFAGGAGLDAVIGTHLLAARPRRNNRVLGAEQHVSLGLVDALSRSPASIFQELADAALELCHAQSAGISLLDRDQAAFYWPAISGRWREYAGQGTPREFGPCGTVLDRDSTQLFIRPHVHFLYLAEADPLIEEGLLAPFHLDGFSVGTVWVIGHDAGWQFDLEDARQLEGLCDLASRAYRTLVDAGSLQDVPPRPI